MPRADAARLPDHPGTCKATNRQGERCKRKPIPGGYVCHLHGGAAPQVKRRAALRLAALVDPAITLLAQEMNEAEKSADRQRAANSILDRAGITRNTETDNETAKLILIERLINLREQARQELPTQPELTQHIIDEEE